MIDAHQVKEFERPAHAIDPPFEIGGAQLLPVVKRIAPELARLGKIIGRHTRDHDRLSLFIKLKEFGMLPKVCGIMRDKNGQVSDDTDVALARVISQRVPLSKKKKL